MDRKDIQILKTALSEGTTSPGEIHKYTSIPKSTVHYRLNQLRERGVIKNDLFDIDLSKLGLSLTIISEVYAEFDEGYHDIVGEKLANVEGINQVYFTMGDTDFIVIGHVTDRAMVESVVDSYEAIDQIQRTSSKFVISTVKNERHPINDFEQDTLVEALTQEQSANPI
ncbi:MULTISPECIES: Lrp/AsnC family transcriptional regulator [unclassified Halorubrum]|uniref:Lrp/AsnC family transcriptional regulator n=1 Tax=unclassified Halorubrum TaxID=2642239 RepID=UPI000B97E0E9|nr:transcriptional regulator [Halorubrum sp. Hd13]OYR46368.1 transcriptional regulator [Halorubrum sp. Ea8]